MTDWRVLGAGSLGHSCGATLILRMAAQECDPQAGDGAFLLAHTAGACLAAGTVLAVSNRHAAVRLDCVNPMLPTLAADPAGCRFKRILDRQAADDLFFQVCTAGGPARRPFFHQPKS